ncbi:hypothetical protein HY636_03870 [Candidatus Woesearchaeota archaeon]|nr:hypothetical protein [Candidatus Woesearchaeota archaeon]
MKHKILDLIKNIEETINSADISKLSASSENKANSVSSENINNNISSVKSSTNSLVNQSITTAKDRFNFKTQTSAFYQQSLDAQIEQLKERLYGLGADYKKNKNKSETEFAEIFNIAKELSSKEHLSRGISSRDSSSIEISSKDAQNPKTQLNKSITNLDKNKLKAQINNDKLKAYLDKDKLKTQLNKLKNILAVLNTSSSVPSSFKIKIPASIPADIKSEVSLDISELENAFNAGCYRASIILCGRILETCLHRIYFEATGNDLLEKSPGIGLGNLIAKIAEKGITLDPGLTHQIHLINNVRIFSVHKKKELFNPTKQQTYAMILYTMDIVGRLF